MNEKEVREKYKNQIEDKKFDCDSIDINITEEMSDRDIKEKKITVLVEYYYSEFEFLHNETFNNFLNSVLDYFLDRDFTIEEVNDQLIEAIIDKRVKLYYEELENKKVEEKDKKTSKLEKLIELFSLYGIDYMLGGVVGAALQSGNDEELDFSNLEIFINENDLPKLMKICEKYKLEFNDDRFNSLNTKEDFSHDDVSVSSKLHNFNIKFICFERTNEGDMIIKNYFTNEVGEPASLNEFKPVSFVDEVIGHSMINVSGKTILVSSPEFILLSMLNRKKDVSDLKDYVSMERFNKISSYNTGDRRVEIVNLNRTYDDSLEDMFNDKTVSSLEKENNQNRSFEAPKVLQKINPNLSEEGYARIKEIGFSGILCLCIVLIILFIF